MLFLSVNMIVYVRQSRKYYTAAIGKKIVSIFPVAIFKICLDVRKNVRYNIEKEMIP